MILLFIIVYCILFPWWWRIFEIFLIILIYLSVLWIILFCIFKYILWKFILFILKCFRILKVWSYLLIIYFLNFLITCYFLTKILWINWYNRNFYISFFRCEFKSIWKKILEYLSKSSFITIHILKIWFDFFLNFKYWLNILLLRKIL